MTTRRDFIRKSTLATTGISLGIRAFSMNFEEETTYAEKQQERRAQLYKLLCDLPPRDRKISAEVVNVERKNGFILEKLSLDLNGQQQVPAWFAKPENAKSPMSAVLFSHSHGGKYKLGKDELILGNSYMPDCMYDISPLKLRPLFRSRKCVAPLRTPPANSSNSQAGAR